MNAPRENDPNELDRFKRDIDLVDYAERQGYQVTKEGKRGDWHELRKDGEMLIVTRKDDHQVYLNTGDDRDRGSVIDFAKTRGGDGAGLNLGQVRQELRAYLNDGAAPAREYARPVDVAKLNALSVGNPELERQQEEERKTRLISEVLGVKKELSDRSYLHGRGIEDKTIDAPAFQGRIFTAQQNEHKNTAFPLYNEQGLASIEQKNDHYKNLLPLPKNGIWVSHPTDGRDTKVERVVVSESAIDSLSHYQLKHEKDPKNTLYIATSGTPTEAQVALIQRVIDKQEPKEVVLANDRDAGGRQFNINYMNELQPARPLKPVADQEAYREASRPVEWHATSDKYHTGLKVTYHHESAEQGAPQVQQMTDRVARMNTTQEAGPTIHLEVQRSTERETVLRLSVAKSDTAQLEVIGQELYRQREQLRPQPERQQEAFIRVDYATAKDWNRDLELTRQGMNTEQIRAQAQRDEQQREAERQQRLAEQRQEMARQAQARRDNSPEAQGRRAEDNKSLDRAIVQVATAEGAMLARATGEQPGREVAGQRGATPGQPGRPNGEESKPTERGPERREEPASAAAPQPVQREEPRRVAIEQQQAAVPQGAEKQVVIKIDEVAPNAGSRGQAEAVKATVIASGAKAGDIQSTTDAEGIRHSEIKVSYRTDQSEIAKVSNTLDAIGRQGGNSVVEHPSDRTERREIAKGYEMVQPQHSKEITR
jgi:hypothetical protein